MIQRIVFICLVVLFSMTTYSFGKVAHKKQNSDQTVGGVDNKTMNVFMKQVEIYGRIAKPQTVFIIPGTDPRVDGIRIERYFYRDIFRKVEKSTLRKEKVKTQRQKGHILW